MLAWVLYASVVGGTLGVAALLAEKGLRHLGRPVRWAWAAAMLGTVVLPVAAVIAGSAGAPGAAGAAGAAAAGVVPLLEAGAGSVSLNRLLLGLWVALTLVLLANVRLASWTVRRNLRRWRTRRLEEHSLLVSAGFGPGVVGVSRPRIVLPEWVVGSEPWLRRLVLLHEREHVRGGDTRLLLGAVVLAMLVPWCLPLWWQLARLREAVEADCDARVVARTADPRAYAHALLEVAGRPGRRVWSAPALSPSPAELERRIRRITGVSEGRSPAMGASSMAAAVAVGLALMVVPPPALPQLGLEPRPTPPTPPSATVILSIEGEPEYGPSP